MTASPTTTIPTFADIEALYDDEGNVTDLALVEKLTARYCEALGPDHTGLPSLRTPIPEDYACNCGVRSYFSDSEGRWRDLFEHSSKAQSARHAYADYRDGEGDYADHDRPRVSRNAAYKRATRALRIIAEGCERLNADPHREQWDLLEQVHGAGDTILGLVRADLLVADTWLDKLAAADPAGGRELYYRVLQETPPNPWAFTRDESLDRANRTRERKAADRRQYIASASAVHDHLRQNGITLKLTLIGTGHDARCGFAVEGINTGMSGTFRLTPAKSLVYAAVEAGMIRYAGEALPYTKGEWKDAFIMLTREAEQVEVPAEVHDYIAEYLRRVSADDADSAEEQGTWWEDDGHAFMLTWEFRRWLREVRQFHIAPTDLADDLALLGWERVEVVTRTGLHAAYRRRL